ncbi:MAG: pheSB, partial [Firmicutes bacterium]|nr:pheSB [Bacillota bacterium]
MKVSYNWLNDYVAFSLSPEELAQALTARGVVVETLTSANPGVEGVVVGKVREMERHPNADTLWVCQVEVGGGKVLQILTGAQNVTTGALVPAAIPGSKLPGMQLEVKKLRGLESNGMLCSAAELGAGEDSDGIMILPDDPDLVPGQDVADLLGLNDWILELDLTANYASHAQSMVGVAQELAAILGTDPDMPDTYTEDQPNTDIHRLIGIDIQEPGLCDRYVARVVKGVTVGPSPLWLQARVRAAGMRPINNIVDIANFVMLELGQPLHTFDYQKIRGQQIIVRRAEEGERFITLDEQARTLDPDVLVIADAEGPIALAGVMGGMESEVTRGTTAILIESAHFDNINNRRTALRYNLPSEAARRFTKGVDPNGAVT